jgi:glycosyltransferase involved in cell wall biosynthesis
MDGRGKTTLQYRKQNHVVHSMMTQQISVVVNFFNMRREAQRTLHSLTSDYQRDIGPDQIEVIAVDNGSTEPLDGKEVQMFGNNFRYLYHDTKSKSPAGALNRAVKQTSADLVVCLIDGARILSPGILAYTLKAARAFDNPFIYTLAMHLGPTVQNTSMIEGYDQGVEDALLDTIAWKDNGYELFQVSSVALSSGSGFLSDLAESNCVALCKSTYLKLGGFDERFESPGGGFLNLDFFNRVLARSEVQPVMLLGEATFHQFHGGVATNVPISEHPWQRFAEEYESIKGRPYEKMVRPAHFLGHIPPECQHLLGRP